MTDLRGRPSVDAADDLATSPPPPAGWQRLAIGDIADVNPGLAYPVALVGSDLVSFVPMAAVSEASSDIDEHQARPIGEVWRGYTHFQNGDVLVAKITPSMENGKAAIAKDLANGVGCGSTEFHVLRPRKGVLPAWLYHFVHQERFRSAAAAQMKGTAGQLRVPASFIEASEIPIPPLPEQHRIVEAIEAQFSRLDAAVAALKRAQANLERYKASILQAACEGRLVPTEAELARQEGRDYELAGVLLQRILAERRRKWEAEHLGKRYVEPAGPDTAGLPELPEGWVWATVEQIMLEMRNGYFGGRPSEQMVGVPILRISAVRPLSVEFGDLRYLPDVVPDKVRVYTLLPGDLLFTRYNGSPNLVGACGRVRDVSGLVLYPDKLIRVRVVGSVTDTDYLELYFASELGRQMIRPLIKTTAGQHGIAGTDLQRVPVPLPPYEEQVRIAAEVARRLSLSDGAAQAAEVNALRADRLRQSILKRAFEGRLVPQCASGERTGTLSATAHTTAAQNNLPGSESTAEHREVRNV